MKPEDMFMAEWLDPDWISKKLEEHERIWHLGLTLSNIRYFHKKCERMEIVAKGKYVLISSYEQTPEEEDNKVGIFLCELTSNDRTHVYFKHGNKNMLTVKDDFGKLWIAMKAI